MMNLQGKNVILLGGLNGLGLAMARNLLMKRIANLYIIDCREDQSLLQELRSEFSSSNIKFDRWDMYNMRMDLDDLRSMLERMRMKWQYIDLCINGMEILMDRNLEKSMSMNMDLYLNIMLMMREMMDKRKDGRGGMIINLLANLGLQDDLNLQQYLINKQMLLSLTESMAKDRRNEQRGIRIMALMPNINKRNLLRNMDWMRGIGLQEFMMDLSWDRRSDDLWLNDREEDLLWRDDERRNRRLLDEDLLLKDDLRNQDLRKDERRRDQGRREDRRMDERRMDERRMDERRMDERRMDERRMDEKRWDERRGQRLDDMERRMDEDRLMRRDDWQRMQNRRMNEDLLLEEGQRLGGRDYLDGRRMLDRLALNMIRCIEMGENRMLLLVDLQRARNLKQQRQMSRL